MDLYLFHQVIGRDSVLASSSRDLRCGRRLISGLFTRPRLPLGYSYIATVPTGACRLNVTVTVPSENYIGMLYSSKFNHYLDQNAKHQFFLVMSVVGVGGPYGDAPGIG